jgi:hypothetical protein
MTLTIKNSGKNYAFGRVAKFSLFALRAQAPECRMGCDAENREVFALCASRPGDGALVENAQLC